MLKTSDQIETDRPLPDLSEWTRVITPKRALLSINWSELWQYRDLIVLLVRRDFVATYKQTILGPIWFIVQPLITTLMFMLLFHRIAKLPTDGIPDFLFYMCGIVAWNYFADCLNKTAGTFNKNAAIFGKVYFPRLVIPIAIVVSNLISFSVQFVFFICFLLIYYFKGAPIHLDWRIIVTPVLIFVMAALGLGAGCIASSLTTRYRDLTMAIGFGVQLWMYASSVIYPLSKITGWERWVLIMNPMVPVIESFRLVYLGHGVVEIYQLAISFFITVAVLLTGIMMFNHVERTVMDTV